MLYALLLESSELSLLGNERVACIAGAKDDDESWLLGLEAWVPYFVVPRKRREPACVNKEEDALRASSYAS